MNRNFRLWLIKRVDDVVRSFFRRRSGLPYRRVGAPRWANASVDQATCVESARNRQGIFPSLDGMRFALGEEEVAERADLTVQNRQDF